MRHNAEFNEPEIIHTPVLGREITEYIGNSKSGGEGVLVDCTCGEGGHSKLFLENFEALKIIAIDRDRDILEIAEKRLKSYDGRIIFVHSNFSEINGIIEEYDEPVNYILYDFGISSYHIDKSMRGFAFKTDEALDMRLNMAQSLDARYVVNYYKEKRLAAIIYEYGEERWAKKISEFICQRRKEKEIKTTGQLAEIVLRAIPGKFHVKNIHPATRVFQAIRIEVKCELEGIKKSLESVYGLMVPGGRIMAISFHSLEDRIVKNSFRKMKQGCICDLDPRYCVCDKKPIVKILTKKPVKPGNDETALNKRARSSKLRVCEIL